MPRRFLLLLPLVAPLFALVACADALLFDRRLWVIIPLDPRHIWWIAFLFDYPHVVASALTFADRDYARAYGAKLWVTVVVSAVVGLGPPRIGLTNLVLAILALANVRHLVMQQLGIARLMGGAAPNARIAWFLRLSALLFAAALLARLGAKLIMPAPLADATLVLEWVGLACMALATTRLLGDKRYAILNVILFVSVTALAEARYYFFALMALRLVHDLTAYSYYICHDAARHQDRARNWLFALRAGPFKALPAAVITVGASVLLANSLAVPGKGGTELGYAEGVTVALLLFHYIAESWMWRRHAPHFMTLSSPARGPDLGAQESPGPSQ